MYVQDYRAKLQDYRLIPQDYVGFAQDYSGFPQDYESFAQDILPRRLQQGANSDLFRQSDHETGFMRIS